MMKVKFKTFRGIFCGWEKLNADAAEFATVIGKDRVINISHSQDYFEGVVTVWYWSDK
jgi:hypothetical protein